MKLISGMTEGAIFAVLIMMKKQELQGSSKTLIYGVALQTAPLNVYLIRLAVQLFARLASEHF
jgi:hypothetical protein